MRPATRSCNGCAAPRGTEVRLGLERRGSRRPGGGRRSCAASFRSAASTAALHARAGDIGLRQTRPVRAQRSHTELLEALSTAARTQGMRKLILDLRGNSGGFLDQAIAIANEFLPARQTDRLYRGPQTTSSIATIQRRQRPCRRTSTWRCWSTREAPRRAKSSPERLQDNDRGTIIGRRTVRQGTRTATDSRTPDGSAAAAHRRHATILPRDARSRSRTTTGDAEDYDDDLMEPVRTQRNVLGRQHPLRRQR